MYFISMNLYFYSSLFKSTLFMYADNRRLSEFRLFLIIFFYFAVYSKEIFCKRIFRLADKVYYSNSCNWKFTFKCFDTCLKEENTREKKNVPTAGACRWIEMIDFVDQLAGERDNDQIPIEISIPTRSNFSLIFLFPCSLYEIYVIDAMYTGNLRLNKIFYL